MSDKVLGTWRFVLYPLAAGLAIAEISSGAAAGVIIGILLLLALALWEFARRRFTGPS